MKPKRIEVFLNFSDYNLYGGLDLDAGRVINKDQSLKNLLSIIQPAMKKAFEKAFPGVPFYLGFMFTKDLKEIFIPDLPEVRAVVDDVIEEVLYPVEWVVVEGGSE